ncbi:MAG TPA: radical SAM protein [Candidatus Thermoplasmatota archaeon]|nr:radical SAM protein [Candidatus Thermoplasmatota archaeon]
MAARLEQVGSNVVLRTSVPSDIPFEISHNVKEPPAEVKRYVAELLKDKPNATVIRVTKSLCPYCVDEEKFAKMKITAVIFEEGNQVLLRKKCAEHGVVDDKYWEDYDMFRDARVAADFANHLETSHVFEKVKEIDIDCPKMCGLCPKHKSHTGLGNIVITNRCDLSCWYCFFYAKEGEPLYEPSQEQIRMMLRAMKNEHPTGANCVQITGGEPTGRLDLVDIIKIAKEEGYDHVQLNTNGVNIARDPSIAKNVRNAGSNVFYMSFDGVTPKTNPKNFWEAPAALDAARKAPIGVVLVPTVIGGVNDHELGDIIKFGIANIDVVRAVNFQPVSLVGRMPDKLRMRQRITIPGACQKIEEQTNGVIAKKDFFTVPISVKVSKFVEALKGKQTYNLSIHFSCGVGTYVFKEPGTGRIVPISRFLDIEGMLEFLEEKAEEINAARFKNLAKASAVSSLLWKLNTFIDKEQMPQGMDMGKMLFEAFVKGDYDGLRKFHLNSMFIGMMHFMDPYNYDVDRVERCDIHYAMPDGRVVPFCSFNVIPELYRDRVQRKYSMDPKEWAKQNPQYLDAAGKIKDYETKYKREFDNAAKKAVLDRYEQALGRPVDHPLTASMKLPVQNPLL